MGLRLLNKKVLIEDKDITNQVVEGLLKRIKVIDVKKTVLTKPFTPICSMENK